MELGIYFQSQLKITRQRGDCGLSNNFPAEHPVQDLPLNMQEKAPVQKLWKTIRACSIFMSKILFSYTNLLPGLY